MAEIGLGLASPHAFGGGSVQERVALRQKDETDRRINYQELLRSAPPELDAGVTQERMQARYDIAQEGLRTLSELFRQTAPDVLVVVGDDQYEQFQDENMPVFCIYRVDSLPTVRRARSARTGSQAWDSPLWHQLRAEQEAEPPFSATSQPRPSSPNT